MELQVLRDGVAFFSFFFLGWWAGGGLWRSTSSVADTLQGKTKLTKRSSVRVSSSGI